MAAVPMSVVRKLRKSILEGYSVKVLAEKYNVSESSVRAYTKSERVRAKEYV